jgi:nitrate reductase alpha subunit
MTPRDREVRRIYENQEYNTGAWFESLAGVHRANIYAIFVHSDFKEKMDARLGRGMFLSMTSNHVRTSDAGVKEFEVVLWVNLALSKR